MKAKRSAMSFTNSLTVMTFEGNAINFGETPSFVSSLGWLDSERQPAPEPPAFPQQFRSNKVQRVLQRMKHFGKFNVVATGHNLILVDVD